MVAFLASLFKSLLEAEILVLRQQVHVREDDPAQPGAEVWPVDPLAGRRGIQLDRERDVGLHVVHQIPAGVDGDGGD